MPTLRSPLLIALCCLPACDHPAEAPPPTRKPAATQSPLTLEHDFGVLRHGSSADHEFELPLARLGEPFVALRVHLDCSCGRAELLLRHSDGSERRPDGLPTTTNLPRDGERLIVRVTIDTSNKEAVDQPSTPARGYVLLQSPKDMTGSERVQWPLLLRFGIDCPVLCRPFAALDFGAVPQSQQPSTLTTLRGDENHPGLRFGTVHCDDPQLEARLEPGEQERTLRVRCRPGELGHFRALIGVETDLAPGYRLHIPVTWKVVPDLEVVPMPKITFNARLGSPQAEADAARQFVLVRDHDARRPAEFAVARIVADDGRDLRPHFAVNLLPMADGQRQFRLTVRYTGGLQQGVRGRIELTKGGEDGSLLPIELVLFPHKEP